MEEIEFLREKICTSRVSLSERCVGEWLYLIDYMSTKG